jgi:glycosyltransferase involved in cell wall biosynthesis
MKVMLVAPHFPPRYLGGVEIYTKRLADYLTAQGDQPEVVCAERIDSESSEVEIIRDTALGYPVHRLHVNFSGESDPFKATYQSPVVERCMEQLVGETAPDVVHLHSGYLLGGAVLATTRKRRIPTIVTLHDFWFICSRVTLLHPNGARCTGPDSAAKCAWCAATEKRRYRLPDDLTNGRFGRVMVNALEFRPVTALAGWSGAVTAFSQRRDRLHDAFTHADLVLAPSRFLRELMIESGLPAERVVISRYGIDVPAQTIRTPRASSLRVGYLGQLAPHKGIGVLIQAFNELPGAALHAHIYGDPTPHGRYVAKLRTLARGDPRLTFCGPYRHEQVYDLLANLDVIVVPSVWYENSPFVIQEAQAAHVPVLASRLGGMRELVTHETDGLLFEPGDASDLARQLRRLLDEPGLLDRLRPDGTSIRTEDDEMRELSGHYHRLCRS